MANNPVGSEWVVAMGRGFPFIFKFGSKFVLEVLPSVAATVIGGYLLAQLNFSRMSEPAAPPAQAAQAVSAPADPAEAPTVREERATMREVLRARRERAEAPAQVRAKVESLPLPAAPDSIDPKDARPAKEGAGRATVAAVPPAAPARRDVELPRARPETATAPVYVPAPPAAAASTSEPTPLSRPAAVASASEPTPLSRPAAGASEPTPLSPVTVNARNPVPVVPERRGPVHAVFSAFSVVVGQAVNVTGETVNWVIDLPGKAISAGERLIGTNPPPPRPFSNADG
jgi:hypothetical protein